MRKADPFFLGDTIMGKLDVYLLGNQFDPEAMGAKCSQCSLKDTRNGGPIPPEYHDKAVASIVTDFPRDRDLDTKRPMSGSNGIAFNEALQSIGLRRTSVNIHAALACQPPESDLDKVMLKWQRDNKKRVSEGLEARPSPIECCRPRLLMELDNENLITLGRTAYQSVTGRARPIFDIRGGPVEGGLDPAGDFLISEDKSLYAAQINILPTLHPGFVQQAKRWTKAFRSDLSRAFRWFAGQLGWKHPHIVLNPMPDYLEAFLSAQNQTYIFDVETTFDDPLVAKLKCVGISTEDRAVVCHLLSIEGPGGSLVQGPYTDADELLVRGILRDFFSDPTRLKAGHNAGYFDRMVIEQHFGVTPAPLLDTILLHRSVESELPHKLGYVGSVYTDVTAWKEAHTAATAGSDEELGTYCAIDCVVTARAMPKLAEAATLRQQAHVVQFDHKIQDVCVGLHQTGMFVDTQRRDEERRRLVSAIDKYGEEARQFAGNADMNLNSTPQLRTLLFSKWKIAPVNYTKLGDPSTDDESLRLIRTQNKDDRRVTDFIDALRRFRRVSKEYGTYVKRLIPYHLDINAVQGQDEEVQDDNADSTQASVDASKAKRGLILPDGRVHPDYTAHGTTSGRLSSSNPNAQNWPKHLRGMITAQPGNVIVGADADQLELRIITAIARIKRYLDVFDAGGDPHAETAAMMFGKAFTSLTPKSDQWDKLRKIAKGIKYASFYGSGDETVHNLVTSAEDDNGNLLYPDLSLREVTTLKRNWLRGIPELPEWWENTLDEYRSNGFVLDPVLGRRRDFLDGEAFNEIVNFPAQSAGAHIIHLSTFDLLQEIPFGKWGPGTGLIAQVHDALYIECPESEAPWVEKVIKEAMNREVPGLPGVVFSAKPKTGRRWSDV